MTVTIDELFTIRPDAELNLHHVLYAEAWSREAAELGGPARAQVITDDLQLRRRPGYEDAIAFYRSRLINRDLLFDDSMRALAGLLVGRHGTAPEGWREIVQPLRDAYLATDWPQHLPDLREPVRSAWSGYLAGTWDLAAACDRLAQAL